MKKLIYLFFMFISLEAMEHQRLMQKLSEKRKAEICLFLLQRREALEERLTLATFERLSKKWRDEKAKFLKFKSSQKKPFTYTGQVLAILVGDDEVTFSCPSEPNEKPITITQIEFASFSIDPDVAYDNIAMYIYNIQKNEQKEVEEE